MGGGNSKQSHRRANAAACAAFVSLLSLLSLVLAFNVLAQAPSAAGGAAPPLTAQELEKLVSPIALYPDDLIAIILPASTNPLQIVQADRFLKKRKDNPQLTLDDKWDDSVKSLLNYPDVIKTMNDDIDWTASLGEAVAADQSATLAAIQAFRRKTQAAGNLASDDKQIVVVENEVVKIVPADPQVIYVPQYNPSTVIVSGAVSSFGYYPSPYPVYYYPYAPGAAFATGLIWGAAIGAAWDGGHYTTHYDGGTANININRSTTVTNLDRSSVSSARGTSTQWRANKQPGQVRGTTARTSTARVGYGTGASSINAGQSALSGSTGSRRSSSNVTSRQGAGGSAFSGSSSGYQANRDSARGAASRSSAMSAQSARQTPRSSVGGGTGAARGSGGAGAAKGGGGRGGRR